VTPSAFGKYTTVAVLGRGGMADVYRARHPALARDVAVKVIHPHLATEPGFGERFAWEARLVAGLRHPGIVQVHDFDVVDGQPYMVMEYVDGGTLKDHLAGLRARGVVMSLDEAARFLVPIADALDHAHAHGAVHRDLKPANILLTSTGEPVLSDFGIAKILEDSVQLSATGALVGTPAYMSPEQAGSRPVDARSDQYSLGVMLFEMVTGRVPFRGESPTAVMVQHLQEPPPAPRTVNPDLPPAVEAVILKALAKDPGARFATAGDMARAFVAAARGAEVVETIGGRPPADAPTIRDGVGVAGIVATASAASAAPAPGRTEAATVAPEAPLATTPRQADGMAPAGVDGPPSGAAEPPTAATASGRRRTAGPPRRIAAAAAVLGLTAGVGFLAVSQGWFGAGAGGPAASRVPAGDVVPPRTSEPASPTGTPPGPSPAVSAGPPSSGPTEPSVPIAARLTACPATEGLLYLADDFSDPATDWPVRTGPDIVSGYEAGAYHVEVEEPNTWWATSFMPQRLDPSYAVEVRAWPAGEPAEGSYGIYFGALDKDNQFELLVRDSGEYRLVKTVADQEADLVPWTPTGQLDPGSPNWIGVVARGTEVTVCLNGAVVTAREEPSMRLGSVGMVVESGDDQLSVFFDDFTVLDVE
jgi:hypothetical protein